MPTTSAEARQLRVLARVAVLGAVLMPARLVHGGPLVCPVRRLTGLPCPTCGLSRSWHSAARLDLRASTRHHPLGPVTFGLATLVALDRGDGFRRVGMRAPGVLLATVWLAVWVARLSLAMGAFSRDGRKDVRGS